MKMTEREEGYEIDNTTGRNSRAPWIVLGVLVAVLLIWRFVL